jgi:NAD(P)-dependent dehydrogenase (short-subunit alcohol dehydrogenase family)
MGYPALDLTSKTAVVIGGTSGIGLSLAEGLAQAGADVVATGRRAQLVQCAFEKITKLGRRSLPITCDVADRESLEELERRARAEFGHVDILVNCAGTTRRTPFLDVTETEWARVMDINLNGTLRACQVFGRGMIERKYGRIINIASLASFVAFYEVAAYAASKAAVTALTKSLAVSGHPAACA